MEVASLIPPIRKLLQESEPDVVSEIPLALPERSGVIR